MTRNNLRKVLNGRGDTNLKESDVIIIGGGIVGLATAYKLMQRHPHLSVRILEKEKTICTHQTGHNSGVIHSGLYYKPGSIKATNCTKGREELIDFAKKHKIPHEMCGKILVATGERELPYLDMIETRGRENGLPAIERIGPEKIKEIEPHCSGIAGLWVPYTGIINFEKVGKVLVEEFLSIGKNNHCEMLTGHEVIDLTRQDGKTTLRTNKGSMTARYIIGCAGLQSDRIARKDGVKLDMRIVPFRGDYYELVPEAHHKVRNLIYPVPDPDLPFLGVHFTRMIDGGVECGPSAVFCFKREGYNKSDFHLGDTLESLSFWGTWRLFLRHWRYGLGEYSRAFSKKLFLRALQRLIPGLTSEDIVASRAGIRAQALDKKGELLDDFRIEATNNSIHVLNAPSPAATAALAIGDTIVNMAVERFHLNKQ